MNIILFFVIIVCACSTEMASGIPVPTSPAPPLASIFAKADLVIQAERSKPCPISTGAGDDAQFRILRIYKADSVVGKTIPLRLPACSLGTFFLFLNQASDKIWEPSDRFWSVWPASGQHKAEASLAGIEALLTDAADGLDRESEVNRLSTLHLIEGADTIDQTVESAISKYRLDRNPSIAVSALGILAKTRNPLYFDELVDYIRSKSSDIPLGEIQSATAFFASDRRPEDRVNLEKLANSPQPYVRRIALQALRLIASQESIPIVAPLVNNSDYFTSFQAVAFLTEVLKRGDPQCASLGGYDKSAGACIQDWRTWWKTTGSSQYIQSEISEDGPEDRPHAACTPSVSHQTEQNSVQLRMEWDGWSRFGGGGLVVSSLPQKQAYPGNRNAMEFKEAVKIALQSLWANKLRSILTLLGVVIGVTSVIAVVTLVNGANTYVATKFSSYGADVFTVSKMPQIITSPEEYQKFQKRKNILFPDFKYVEENCKHCIGIGAQQAVIGKIVRGTQSTTDTGIRGYTWQMPALQNLNITQGRGFTEADEEHASRVAIIGTDIQDHLFAGVDPLGQELRVDGTPYTIIGISEKQGSTFGASQDNWVGVPLTAFQKSYGTSKTLTIYVKAGEAGPVLETAADEVRVLVRSRRHDAPGAEDSFELDTNNTLVGFFSTVTKSFGAVAGGVAMIALVVGGIVIMNIMLVSVTERTREIGIRKALGARPHDILMQFLIESGTMALVGGVFGVIGGILVAQVITLVAGFPSTVAVWSVLAGLVMATGTGVFFGVYPARKAAQLDPIVALRAE